MVADGWLRWQPASGNITYSAIRITDAQSGCAAQGGARQASAGRMPARCRRNGAPTPDHARPWRVVGTATNAAAAAVAGRSTGQRCQIFQRRQRQWQHQTVKAGGGQWRHQRRIVWHNADATAIPNQCEPCRNRRHKPPAQDGEQKDDLFGHGRRHRHHRNRCCSGRQARHRARPGNRQHRSWQCGIGCQRIGRRHIGLRQTSRGRGQRPGNPKCARHIHRATSVWMPCIQQRPLRRCANNAHRLNPRFPDPGRTVLPDSVWHKRQKGPKWMHVPNVAATAGKPLPGGLLAGCRLRALQPRPSHLIFDRVGRACFDATHQGGASLPLRWVCIAGPERVPGIDWGRTNVQSHHAGRQ